MKHFLFNLTKSTAKATQNAGGGASQKLMRHEDARGLAQSDNRYCIGNASDLSPRLVRFDSLSILSRQSDLDQVRAISVGLSARAWKHVAMIFAVLVMSIANIGLAWGAYDVPANGTVTLSQKVNNGGRFNVEASGVYHFRLADGYSWSSGDGIKTQSNQCGVIFYLDASTEIEVGIKHTETKNAHDVTVHVYSIPESEYKQFDDNKAGAAERNRTFSTGPSTSSDNSFTISVTAESKTFKGTKTLAAGYYAVVPVGSQSKTYFNSIKFTSGGVTRPTFSPATGSSLVKSTGTVTLTSSGNTVYYKWSQTDNQYASGAGATLAGAADNSGTSPVNTTAPSTAGTWYLYAVAYDGDAYSNVVKATYTITNPTHTLTWNLDGGTATGGTAAGAVAEGATLTAPTVTKVGYDFAGWSPAVPATMPSSDATYTATWTKVYASGTYNFVNQGDGSVTWGSSHTVTLPAGTKTTVPAGSRVDNIFFSTALDIEYEKGAEAGTGYKGWKIKQSGKLAFYVENDCDVIVTNGIINGMKIHYYNQSNVETNTNLTSTAGTREETAHVKGGTLFEIVSTTTSTNTLKGIRVSSSCTAPTSPSISGTTTYTAGGTISLTASATGTTGSSTYTWYKGADWATASATSSIGSTATFSKASCVVGDAGTYWCNISNGTGCDVQVSKTITVGYSVTYNGSSADDGTVPVDGSSPYASGSTVTVLGNTGSLARAIYEDDATFEGWNTNSNMYGGTHYNAGETFSISGNTTLYAVWGYSITWNKNGGDWVEYTAPSYYIYGQGLASLPSSAKISKSGYELDHWELDYNNSTVSSIADDATGSVQLNAIWTEAGSDYTLTWDFNGGGCTETAGDDYTAGGDVTSGTTLVYPSNSSMSKPGYKFNGWSSSPSTMPASDLTLTAQWESFELPDVSGLGVDDGATLSSIPLSWKIPGICDLSAYTDPWVDGSSKISDQATNQSTTLGISNNIVTSAGYANGCGQHGVAFPISESTASITGVTAITIDCKGNDFPGTHTIWGGVVNSSTTYTYWDYDADLHNYRPSDFGDNSRRTFTIDTRYWQEDGYETSTTIDYIAIFGNAGCSNAGNNSFSVREVRYHVSDREDIDHVVLMRKEGSAAAGIADPSATKLYEGTKSHYTDASDVTGKNYYYTVFAVHANGAVSTGVSTSLTLYTITYNAGANGSGTVPAGKKTHGIDFTLSSSTFTREGFTQDGWSTSDGGDKRYELGDTYDEDADIPLYPHWVAVSGPVITNGNPANGSIAITSDSSTPILSAVTGSTVYIAATPSTGYNFTSWDVYKTDDASTKVSTAAATASTTFEMPSYAVTVNASFSAKTYTVTLNGNGGSGNTANVTATYGSSSFSSSITNPTKTGYIFDGWYSGSGGSGTLIISTAGVLQSSTSYSDGSGNWTNDGNVTLYAKWTRDVKTAGWGEPWGGTAIPSNTTSTVSGVTLNATGITKSSVWTKESYNLGNGDAITINLPDGYYISAVSTSSFIDTWIEEDKANTSTNRLYIQFNSESTYDDSSYDLDDPITLADGCYDDWETLGSATPASVSSIPSGAQSAKIYCSGNYGSGGYLYRIIVEITAYDCTPHTVTFANGGGTGSVPLAREVCGELTLPGSGSLAKKGNTFAGWNDGEDDYEEGDTYSVTGNVTFTALWTPFTVPAATGLAVDEDFVVTWNVPGKLNLSTATLSDEDNYFIKYQTPAGSQSYNAATEELTITYTAAADYQKGVAIPFTGNNLESITYDYKGHRVFPAVVKSADETLYWEYDVVTTSADWTRVTRTPSTIYPNEGTVIPLPTAKAITFCANPNASKTDEPFYIRNVFYHCTGMIDVDHVVLMRKEGSAATDTTEAGTAVLLYSGIMSHYTDESVVKGKTYYYTVFSVHADGTLSAGTTQSATVPKDDLDITYAAGTASSVTHNSATLPFTMSATTGVASVTLKVYNTSDVLVKTVANVTAATSGSGNVTGLSGSTTYYYTVTPIGDADHNDGAESSKSATFTTSAATLSAIETSTLYKVEDMVPSTLTLSETGQYDAGLSENTYFEVIGDPSETDGASGTPEMKNESASFADQSFTARMYLKGKSNTSGSGTTLVPTSRAIKFIIPTAGLLDIYAHRVDRLYLKKAGDEGTTQLGTSTSGSGSKVSHTVTAGTYYIYSVNSSTCIYGMELKNLHSLTTTVSGSVGGTVSAASSVAEGESTIVTATPATGYWVTEWEVSGTGATISDDGSMHSTTTTLTMGTANATVTVTFGLTDYSVTYDGNGGSGSAPADANTYNYGGEVTVVSGCGTLTKSGYTFRGWMYDGNFYRAGDKFDMPAEDVTLTAVWESNTGSETVTLTHYGKQYDTGSPRRGYAYVGSTSGTRYIYETNNSNAKNINNDSSAVRLDYNSAYLKILGSGATTSITDSLFSSVTQVSFKWKLYNSGSSDKTTTVDVYVGSTKVGNAIELTGQNSDGFQTKTISGIESKNGAIKIVNTGTSNSNQNLHLDDIAITCTSVNYDITFADGSIVPASHATWPSDIEGVPSGSKVLKPADPTAAGYTFAGWYENEACTGDAFDDWSSAVTEDISLYAKWAPVALTYIGSDWNSASSWDPACVPTIEHDVIIPKVCFLQVADAKAKSVTIHNYGDGETEGKLYIYNGGPSSYGGLVVAEGIKAVHSEGGTPEPTTDRDLSIHTDFDGNAGLICGEASSNTQATYVFYSKVYRYESYYINQYVGIPFASMDPYDWYSLTIFEYDDTKDKWKTPVLVDGKLKPFTAYNIISKVSGSYMNWYYLYGTLNLPGTGGTKPLTCGTRVATAKDPSAEGYNADHPFFDNGGDYMFANSWTAPISIKDMTASDISDLDGDEKSDLVQCIYIFNAGYVPKGDDTKVLGELSGTWSSFPFGASTYMAGAVIPAGQAFLVTSKVANATLTLDYGKHVYNPALASGLNTSPLRAPRRNVSTEDPNVLRIKVVRDSIVAEQLYILEREDFTFGYDDGWDGNKIMGLTSSPQLYAQTGTEKMAVSAVPDITGLELGFKAGTDTNAYYFSFEYNDSEPLYLYDRETQIFTRINNEASYEFLTNDTDEHARFIITRSNAPMIETGTETLKGEENRAEKFFENNMLFIRRGEKVYNVDGSVVK